MERETLIERGKVEKLAAQLMALAEEIERISDAPEEAGEAKEILKAEIAPLNQAILRLAECQMAKGSGCTWK